MKSYFEDFFKNDETNEIPFVFLRTFNEINTIKMSLKSAMGGGGIMRGILGYHLDKNNQDDGTEEALKQFANENFKLVRYPHQVILNSKKTAKEDMNINLWFASYYNFILDQIPDNEWFIKIDGDHLYNPVALKLAIEQKKSSFDVICLPYINMHIENNELFFIKNGDLRTMGDHWIVKKLQGIHFSFKYEWNCEFLELTKEQKQNIKQAENIISLHFPFIKSRRRHFATKDLLIPFDEFDLNSLNLTEIDKEFLNKERILKDFKERNS